MSAGPTWLFLAPPDVDREALVAHLGHVERLRRGRLAKVHMATIGTSRFLMPPVGAETAHEKALRRHLERHGIDGILVALPLDRLNDDPRGGVRLAEQLRAWLAGLLPPPRPDEPPSIPLVLVFTGGEELAGFAPFWSAIGQERWGEMFGWTAQAESPSRIEAAFADQLAQTEKAMESVVLSSGLLVPEALAFPSAFARIIPALAEAAAVLANMPLAPRPVLEGCYVCGRLEPTAPPVLLDDLFLRRLAVPKRRGERQRERRLWPWLGLGTTAAAAIAFTVYAATDLARLERSIGSAVIVVEQAARNDAAPVVPAAEALAALAALAEGPANHHPLFPASWRGEAGRMIESYVAGRIGPTLVQPLHRRIRPTSLRLDDAPMAAPSIEAARFAAAMKSMAEAERLAARFEDLTGPDGAAVLADLVRDLEGTAPPTDWLNKPSYQLALAAAARALPLERVSDTQIEQAIERLARSLRTAEDVGAAEEAAARVAAALERLSSAEGEAISEAQNELRAALEEVKRRAAGGELVLAAAPGQLLAKLDGVPMPPPMQERLRTAIEAAGEEVRARLAGPASALSPVLTVEQGELRLGPHAALLDGILTDMEHLLPPGQVVRNGLEATPPRDSSLSAGPLRRAAEIARAHAGLMKRLDDLPPQVHAPLYTIATARLNARVTSELAAALAEGADTARAGQPVETEAESFTSVAKDFGLVLDTLRRHDPAGYDEARWTALVTVFGLLERLDAAYERDNGLRLAPLIDRWDGRGAPVLAALGLRKPAEVKQHFDHALARTRTYAALAEPITAFLRRSDFEAELVGAALLRKWQILSLRGEPASLQALRRLITVELMAFRKDSCPKLAAPAEPLTNDPFSAAAAELRRALHHRCQTLAAATPAESNRNGN